MLVDKVVDPAGLHDALSASGVSVKTVRGAHSGIGQPAYAAVVVLAAGADDKAAQAVIDAHNGGAATRPARAAIDKSLSGMEAKQ